MPTREPAGQMAIQFVEEIRAEMGRQRISGAQLADKIGMSQNYTAVRLRGDAPLTVNDVENICKALALHPLALIRRVHARKSAAQA